MNCVSMKEFEAMYVKANPVSAEEKEQIENLVGGFFGEAEFVYQYDDDENVAMALGFFPVQRLNRQEVANRIVTIAGMNPQTKIGEIINGTLCGLKTTLPQDMC